MKGSNGGQAWLFTEVRIGNKVTSLVRSVTRGRDRHGVQLGLVTGFHCISWLGRNQNEIGFFYFGI